MYKSVEKVIEELYRQTGLQATVMDRKGQIIATSADHAPEYTEPQLETLPWQQGRAVWEGRCFGLFPTCRYGQLVAAVEGDDAHALTDCYLLCKNLEMLLKASAQKPNLEQSLRKLLLGEMGEVECAALLRENGLDGAQPHCVLILSSLPDTSENIFKVVEAALPKGSGSLAVRMDNAHVALMQGLQDDEDDQDVLNLAQALQETIISELSVDVIVGIGLPAPRMDRVHDSYAQAREALQIGMVQDGQGSIYCYGRMLFERFLHAVPAPVRRAFIREVGKDNLSHLMNEEMNETLRQFFAHSLNLSETARTLFIHRNTLVYRLDKVYRATGLDLRRFEDAVTFRILMALLSYE